LRPSSDRQARARLLADRLADAAPVRGAEHHHDEIRLVGIDDFFCGARPVVGFTALLGADQSGIQARLARDADFRGLGESLFKSIAQPLGHRIAEHQDVGRRRDVRLARRRRARGVDRRLPLRLIAVAERIKRLLLLVLAIAPGAIIHEGKTVIEELRRRRPHHGEPRDGPGGHFGKAEQRKGDQAPAPQPFRPLARHSRLSESIDARMAPRRAPSAISAAKMST